MSRIARKRRKIKKNRVRLHEKTKIDKKQPEIDRKSQKLTKNI